MLPFSRGMRMVELARSAATKDKEDDKHSKASEQNVLNNSTTDAIVADVLLNDTSELNISTSVFEESVDETRPDTAVPLHDTQSSHPVLKAPEDYLFDGSASVNRKVETNRKRKREDRKTRRNLGLSYVADKSQRVVDERRVLGPRCDGKFCDIRHLSCSAITDNTRLNILTAFWDLGDLHQQRNWVAQHVQWLTSEAREDGTPRKRKRTITYLLPHEGKNTMVCQTMFLNTIGVSTSFPKTVIKKINEYGVLEKEKRGGRTENNKDCDDQKRKAVETHINRFPRMESHYCRASTSLEYLAPDLTVAKMYELYKADCGHNIPVSYSFYHKIFQKKNLRFHLPKKDTCGLCETKHKDNLQDEEFIQQYTKHIGEKDEIRKILKACTEESERNANVAMWVTWGYFD